MDATPSFVVCSVTGEGNIHRNAVMPKIQRDPAWNYAEGAATREAAATEEAAADLHAQPHPPQGMTPAANT